MKENRIKPYEALRRRIVAYCQTMANFADKMSFSENTLSKKINKKSPWRLDEITLACKILEISSNEIEIYFLQ